MLTVPEMIMIGGNSRNSGKTTMACSIIRKLAATREVIGLKVTSIRPGEEDLHGNHLEGKLTDDFSIFEEVRTDTHKDTSKMLKAGASHVYYIRVSETHIENALLYFMSRYIKKEIIVCESRSLREIIKPGLFLVMMRIPAVGKAKDIAEYLALADKVFHFGEDLKEIEKFTTSLSLKDDKFNWN
jgi:hypothetical protein